MASFRLRPDTNADSDSESEFDPHVSPPSWITVLVPEPESPPSYKNTEPIPKGLHAPLAREEHRARMAIADYMEKCKQHVRAEFWNFFKDVSICPGGNHISPISITNLL
jgi:hypothetical protein